MPLHIDSVPALHRLCIGTTVGLTCKLFRRAFANLWFRASVGWARETQFVSSS